MNTTNTSTPTTNTTTPVPTLSPVPLPVPTPSPTPGQVITLQRIKNYEVETSSGQTTVLSDGNAVVLQVFAEDGFVAEPQPPLASGTVYVVGQLEDRFIFHSPLFPRASFYPYTSPLNLSIVGGFPYQDIALNASTGVFEGQFTSTCDISPLPIVPFVLTDNTGGAVELGFDEEAPANITILANTSMVFEGYNRQGLIDPLSGTVLGWNESTYPEMPSPVVSPPFWLLFNCARNRSFELGGLARSLHFAIRVGASNCFQYPQSPTFVLYATSVFFSIPFLLVAIAGVCLLLWTLNWTVATCRRICKRRKGRFEAPPTLSRTAQLASMQNSPSLTSVQRGCGECMKRQKRPRLRDLRQKQNMDALRTELEELNSELNRIVEPPPAYCSFGACALIGCLFSGLVLGAVGTRWILNNLDGVPPLEPEAKMELASTSASIASNEVTLLNQNFDELVEACGSPAAWIENGLASELGQLTAIAKLSDPAKFPLLGLINVGLRPDNDVFVLPAVIVFLFITSLLLLFAFLAVLFGCTTCRWGSEEVICTRMSTFLGGYLFTFLKGFCVLSWVAAATLTYLAMTTADVCFEPAFLEANVNVSAGSPIEEQKQQDLYTFNGEFNLARFFYNCQYGSAYNPYSNYSSTAAQLHLRISAALNESWSGCTEYTMPPNSSVPSIQESYEDVMSSLGVIVEQMSCATYGEEIGWIVEIVCIRDLGANIFQLLAASILSLASLLSVFWRRGFVPNLYRTRQAMYIHRHAKEKLELYLAASHSHNSSRFLSSIASTNEITNGATSPEKVESSVVKVSDLAVT